MNKTETLVDVLFWAILLILLLMAVGTVIAGAVLTQDSGRLERLNRQTEGGLLIGLGSLGIVAALAAGVTHTVLTWKRGNWVKSIHNAVTGVPAFVQKKYDNRLHRLKEEKGQERLRKQIVRCRAKTARKADKLICDVIAEAKERGTIITTVEDLERFKADNKDAAVDRKIAEVQEANRAEAEKEAEQELGPIQQFATEYTRPPPPAQLPTPQPSQRSLVSYSALPADAARPGAGRPLPPPLATDARPNL